MIGSTGSPSADNALPWIEYLWGSNLILARELHSFTSTTMSKIETSGA